MSSSSLQTPASGHAVSSRPAIKRRNIRKGTFSCWECKHRKTRCEFKPVSNPVCVSCHRRGLSCISQEFDETIDSSSYEKVEKRIVHVEALVNRLVRQRNVRQPHGRRAQSSQGASGFNDEIPEDHSPSTADMTRSPSCFLAVSQDLPSRCRSLSNYLHSIFPHPTIVALIMTRGKLPFQLLRRPVRMLRSSGTGAEQLAPVAELPPLTAHPVLFARQLIRLALCLQQLDAKESEQLDLRLNEPFCEAARRYVDIARHVTSQDLLVNSLEGLETLMLEGSYQINVGNLHSASLIFRRALGIAQVMGIPQLAETAGGRVEFMWFRLICADRFLSLVLGLPFAVSDNSFASEHLLALDVPSGKLERIHVVVSGRIITRNIRMQRRRHRGKGVDDAYDDYKETQEIDFELKQALRSLPVSWWVLPTMYNAATDVEAMEETARLLTQMHQYYLLILVHQPYLIQGPHSQPTTSSTGSTRHCVDYTYSKLAVLSASREVLSRFLLFRSFHHIRASYPGLDHKAFTASMALLLAHLDGHRLGRANVLEHQRPHDLAILDNVINTMEGISRLNKEVSTSCSAQVLRKLLEIEADAAYGANYVAWGEEGANINEDCEIRKDDRSLNLSIPYFGTIHIVRQGPKRTQLTSLDHDSIRMAGFAPEASTITEYNNLVNMEGDNSLTISPSLIGVIATSESQLRPSVLPGAEPNSYDQTADVQDWPYQEMDTAFLSTWIRGETETDETLVETGL